MHIESIPAGTRCLIDANILIFHLTGASEECRDLLFRIAKGDLAAHLTTTVIAEVLHRMMLIEAVSKGIVTPNKVLRKLKERPELIGQLTDHADQLKRLLKLPFVVLGISTEDIRKSHSLRKRHHLFVNDSINLACAMRHGLKNIVTHDADFERVKTIKIWSPIDV